MPSRLLRPSLLAIPLSLAIVLAAALVGCGRPLLLLPGGALEGTPAAAPESWSFTDEVDTIQLETNPAEPYSVNLWVVALDEHLYIHAGANRSAWVEHLEADPNVRLRVDDSIYELVSSRVEAQEEFDRFSDAYDRKYGMRPRNGDVAEAYLFRLAAR
jgi:hypothetical protein